MAAEDAPESAAAKPARRRKHLVSDILRIGIIVAVCFVALYFVKKNYGEYFHSVDGVKQLVEKIRSDLHPDDTVADQLKSYAIFIAAGALMLVVGLPRWIVAVTGGSLYGALLGGSLSLVSSLIGATIVYILGASMLKGMMRRRLGRRFEVLKEKFRANGFGYTLTLRIFPLSNATLTSLICGACRVKVADYTLANIIGLLPQTIIFSLIGSGASKGSKWQIGVGIALQVLVLVAHHKFKNRFAQREPLETE
ncbi:hypothetical protein BH09SUM1_BH09SUM1_28520 [soil metagenome]